MPLKERLTQPPARPHRRSRQTLLASLAALLIPAIGLAEPVTLQRAPSGHLIVEVEIGDSGPYTFLLDTGASNTAIAQPVAEELGFHSVWENYGDVQSLTTRFSAERFALHDLRFGDLEPVSLNSVVIPVDPTQPHPVAGLLGADALPTDHYRLDFAAATLTLDSAAPDHADGWVNPQNLLLGQADLRRGMRGVRVLVDSGSARTLVNEQLLNQVHNHAGGITYSINGIEGRLQDETVAEAETVLLRNLQLGGLCLNSVVALQADLDIFEALDWSRMPAMVIGMDVLRYATLTVDREAGVFEISAAEARDVCRNGRAQAEAPEPDRRR
ncbi:aspartyl protease family protein [Maricaulis sp.]|uniref:aspartyl protease family protein n=1 Tax=Maricaulis sp. TaxID=1486257 RepID=UPI003A8D5139